MALHVLTVSNFLWVSPGYFGTFTNATYRIGHWKSRKVEQGSIQRKLLLSTPLRASWELAWLATSPTTRGPGTWYN